jgi:hypothetical protein
MALISATTQLYRKCSVALLSVVGVGVSFLEPAYAIVAGGVRSEPVIAFFGVPAPLLLGFIVISLALLAIWLITRSMLFAVLFAIIEIGGLSIIAKSVGWDVVQADVVCHMYGTLPAFEVVGAI